MLVRYAFAIGQPPWDVDLTGRQLAFLEACDSFGLVPHAMRPAGIVASTAAELKRDRSKRGEAFAPEDFYVAKRRKQQTPEMLGKIMRGAIGSTRTAKPKAWP